MRFYHVYKAFLKSFIIFTEISSSFFGEIQMFVGNLPFGKLLFLLTFFRIFIPHHPPFFSLFPIQTVFFIYVEE